ncbi:FAD binding domain-containing protein [Fusarium solani]|uniref:FAD binding domain-containing protein n=1 Tax=Fusarium solani TaxID=169388 RepID=A0A9P9HWA5_FUSSL|nr:FAD binding domain-containing protein [Fusarium solani]KAH7264556.1 FAD binding domain-containing protein [Fusarium solani]
MSAVIRQAQRSARGIWPRRCRPQLGTPTAPCKAALNTTASRSHPASGTHDTQHFDVVVIGSGCAGLTSAVVAAKHGLRTLVLEKSDFFGGTTAFSGGGAWIPNNAHQKTINVVDSRESAEKYLRNVLGDLYDHDMIASFLQNAPIMLQWMQAHSSVQFKPVALPDYHVGKEGASVGRTILTQEYDGRQLGRQRLRSVRYTLQGYHAFGSMQADPAELPVLSNPFQSMSNLAACIRKITRFGLDVLLYGKGSEMANGNALVGRLVKSCDDAGVELQANSPVARLKRLDDTGAFSVVAEDSQGHAKEFVATKGVILASGGFGRSQDARAYLPHDWSVQPKGNVGDGQRMGREVGAAMPPPNPKNGVFAPLSLLRTRSGQVRRYPHFSVDRTKPGSIIINTAGRRFANEAEPYQEFVQAMHEEGIEKAFLVADSRFLRRYGMGMALPWPMSPHSLIAQGYLIKAGTLHELADKIQVPPDALRDTVAACNKNATKGLDPEFGRGQSSYDLFYGDPSAGFPNPSLGTCSQPPFYALTLYPGNVCSTYGLQTNAQAQVIDTSNEVIPGLYAVGLDANSIMRGEYPGGGSSIGPAMTFGYIAGMSLAGK